MSYASRLLTALTQYNEALTPGKRAALGIGLGLAGVGAGALGHHYLGSINPGQHHLMQELPDYTKHRHASPFHGTAFDSLDISKNSGEPPAALHPHSLLASVPTPAEDTLVRKSTDWDHPYNPDPVPNVPTYDSVWTRRPR